MKVPLHCIVCTKPIPLERILRGAVTDVTECARQVKHIRRRLADEKKCRHCNAPSTPAERKEYHKWRKSQPGYVQRRRGRPRTKATSA